MVLWPSTSSLCHIITPKGVQFLFDVSVYPGSTCDTYKCYRKGTDNVFGLWLIHRNTHISNAGQEKKQNASLQLVTMFQKSRPQRQAGSREAPRSTDCFDVPALPEAPGKSLGWIVWRATQQYFLLNRLASSHLAHIQDPSSIKESQVSEHVGTCPWAAGQLTRLRREHLAQNSQGPLDGFTTPRNKRCSACQTTVEALYPWAATRTNRVALLPHLLKFHPI